MTATATDRTFGIEIELFLPRGWTNSRLAAEVARVAGVAVCDEYYNHSTREHWKVVTDGSLSMPGRRGAEVVSPVLKGEEGLAELRRVMKALDAAKCRVNVSTGLHVHIGAREFTLNQMKNFAKNYIKFEDFFDHIQPNSRRACNNQYIRSNRAVFGDYSEDSVNRAFDRIDACRETGELINAINPFRDRYRKLNLTSFYRYGTIEFRQHSGTVDADKAENWVRLLLAFVEVSANGRPRKRARPDVSEREAFQRFFAMFKCKALRPYFSARRKSLLGLVARTDAEQSRIAA